MFLCCPEANSSVVAGHHPRFGDPSPVLLANSVWALLEEHRSIILAGNPACYYVKLSDLTMPIRELIQRG